MQKKIILQYNAVVGNNKKVIKGKILGEVKINSEILRSKGLLRTYAFLHFHNELLGKEKVEISVYKPKV